MSNSSYTKGFTRLDDASVATYEIIGASDQISIEQDKAASQQNSVTKYGESFQYGGYVVATHGLYNNLPQEVSGIIRGNAILPEILKKQVRILYGQGLYLYREEENQERKRYKVPVTSSYPGVLNWLSSWKKNGLKQSAEEYIKSVIFEYYYMEGYYDKFIFNKSRRINGSMPVRGLESMSGIHMRLAKRGTLSTTDWLKDGDCNVALYGRWDYPFRFESTEYPRFDEANPLRYGTAINYVADKGFDDQIYSVPTYYYGLKEWIRGSNLNPKYINSYLKNSLNAKIHVLIPNAWIESKEKALMDICEMNKDREQAGEELITGYDGLEGLGTTFHYGFVQQLIDVKIKQATSVLSGEGENQGKLFVSRRFSTENGIEEWEFKEIPTKFKEFIESITEYEKQAQREIVTGKGLDPAISNVSNEGIFNNSGSQVYYNYLIYLDSLRFAEDYVCKDINIAARMNFPQLGRDNVKIGLYQNKPERQSEVGPQDRMENI